MRRVEFLSWVVWGTVSLVAAGALLLVVWLFDSALGWDLVHGAVEQLLYGVLGSALALGACGAAIGGLLSLLEIAHGIGRWSAVAVPAGGIGFTSSWRRFLTLAGAGIALLATVLGGLAWVNQRVQAHRGEVFATLAGEQMAVLAPRTAPALATLGRSRPQVPPPAVVAALSAVQASSFCQGATLLLADPDDPEVLWRYRPSYRQGVPPARFERLYVAGKTDRAVRQALAGDPSPLDRLNGGPGFVFHHLLRDADGQPLAVIRLDGDPRESFREYAGGPDRSASL
jgi:hypothetical protein